MEFGRVVLGPILKAVEYLYGFVIRFSNVLHLNIYFQRKSKFLPIFMFGFYVIGFQNWNPKAALLNSIT